MDSRLKNKIVSDTKVCTNHRMFASVQNYVLSSSLRLSENIRRTNRGCEYRGLIMYFITGDSDEYNKTLFVRCSFFVHTWNYSVATHGGYAKK